VESSSSGTLKSGTFDKSHLIASGLEKLYEGDTICFPLLHSTKLRTFAQSTDGHPAICYANDEAERGSGRIVLDTGFTKLWKNWEYAGTARYICNATVWLLGLEYRLENNMPLRGPTRRENFALSRVRTPLYEPEEVSEGLVDVVFVVPCNADTPVQCFGDICNICKSVAGGLLTRKKSITFGIVSFAQTAYLECSCTAEIGPIYSAADRVRLRHNKKRGQNYRAGLAIALAELEMMSRSKPAQKVIIFLTSAMPSNTETTNNSEWKNKAMIFGVGVGPMLNLDLLESITGDKRRVLPFQYVSDRLQLRSFVDRLVGEVASTTSD